MSAAGYGDRIRDRDERVDVLVKAGELAQRMRTGDEEAASIVRATCALTWTWATTGTMHTSWTSGEVRLRPVSLSTTIPSGCSSRFTRLRSPR
jgi:hypothetical protein